MKYYFVKILMLILMFNNLTLLYAKTEKNLQDIDFVKSKANFDLTSIYDLPDVKKIYGVNVIKWAPMRRVVLRDQDYPSKEKMIEIKNTPKIMANLSLEDSIECFIRLGKFQNYDDSYLAFVDSVPSQFQWKKTLFSGETLEDSVVITIDKFDSTASAYLFYKNCLCCFSITHSGELLVKKDFLVIDQLIKNFRIVIDKSLKN